MTFNCQLQLSKTKRIRIGENWYPNLKSTYIIATRFIDAGNICRGVAWRTRTNIAARHCVVSESLDLLPRNSLTYYTGLNAGNFAGSKIKICQWCMWSCSRKNVQFASRLHAKDTRSAKLLRRSPEPITTYKVCGPGGVFWSAIKVLEILKTNVSGIRVGRDDPSVSLNAQWGVRWIRGNKLARV